MFATLAKTLVARTGLKATLAVAVLGLSPAAAMAGGIHDNYHVDLEFRHGHPHIDIVRIPPPVVIAPAPAAEERVWVEPVCQTVTERQWVPAEYRTVVDHVWVPDQFETREYPRWDHGRRVIYRERVLVSPGHYQDVPRQELVCEGHYQDVTHQVMVTPGHWETRVTPALAPLPGPVPYAPFPQ